MGSALSFRYQKKKEFDSVIVFVEDEKELEKLLPEADKKRGKEGQLWLSYPKKSGSIETDLNRDVTWNSIKAHGLEPVRLISVNEDWSSMRVVRKSDRKKPSKFGQDPPGVNRTTKIVTPPDDLLSEFEKHSKAKDFFESLAFSHKREYVAWIYGAKKEATRKRRIKRTIEALKQGKKTR